MDISAIRAFAIKEGAAEESLVKRPLTWDEFSKMGEAESHWHCVANSKAVDAVHEVHSKELRELKSLARKKTDEVFNQVDHSSPAVKNTVANFEAFMARYAQYIHLPIHVADIVVWLRKNSMLPDENNIATAWKALAREGKTTINGFATGLVDETELTGRDLEFHPQLNRLLEPVTPEIAEYRRVQRMPDAEFKKWDAEHHGPKQIPPMIKARIDKSFVTFASQHPEFIFNDANKTKLLDYLSDHHTNIDYNSIRLAYENLAAAGALEINADVIVKQGGTTWTDYSKIRGNETPVTPVPQPTVQENLRRKIASMSSEDYDKWLQSPANRRAADNLR